MEFLYISRQLKQEVGDVSYLDYLLFVIREPVTFMLQRHFVVRLAKTTQVALEWLHF